MTLTRQAGSLQETSFTPREMPSDLWDKELGAVWFHLQRRKPSVKGSFCSFPHSRASLPYLSATCDSRPYTLNRPNWLIGNPISWFLIHFFCAALWRQRRLPHTACEEQDSLQPRLWGLLCRQMCMYSLYWSPGKVACLEAVLPRPAAVMKIKPQSTTS